MSTTTELAPATTPDVTERRSAVRTIAPALHYIGSVLFDRGLALLTIPLAAAYLAPSDFGRLDVAVSLIEVVGLVLALAHGECLLRFAGATASGAERRRVAAEFLGSGLLAAVVLGAVLQLLAPMLVVALSIGVDLHAMRWALAGAAVTALIDMPLMWLRLHQRSGALFAFSATRSIVQVATMWIVLASGGGADGVLIANAGIAIACAGVLTLLHVREHGTAWSLRGFLRAGSYGTPLVVSGLATFAVGSLSRWFLSGNVADAEIAHMALAAKLGLATSLVLQPFALWWIARRMVVLSEPGGHRRSAEMWGIGVVVLLLGATGICLVGPVFIHHVFPVGYHPAIVLLPAAVMVCVLNELSTLCNLGSHMRTTGLSVMGINIAGGLAAVLGYVLLIPSLGTLGALIAMALGHAVRLALFLVDGRRLAPIPYPASRALALAVVALALVAAAPPVDAVLPRLGWSAFTVLLLVSLALALALLKAPWSWAPGRSWRPADARVG